MFGDLHGPPEKIGFLLIPNFSMIALMSAIEPLRLANYVTGRDLYQWTLYSGDGDIVKASSGIGVMADRGLDDTDGIATMLTVAGLGIQQYENKKVVSALRRLAARGTDIGSLCTATFLLARAGLLDGYRCTIHWENLPAFTEEFPDIEVSSEIYQIDRNRSTCSGGTAALDMMLHLIAMQHGHELATQVSDELIYDKVREASDQQRMALRLRLGVSHPKLLDVVSHMEEGIEFPLSQTELAQSVGLSTRQLERLFRKYLDRTPTRYYLELRLNRARTLLLQTSMSVLNVALASGFGSASHFSKCYREYFGRTPREERRMVH